MKLALFLLGAALTACCQALPATTSAPAAPAAPANQSVKVEQGVAVPAVPLEAKPAPSTTAPPAATPKNASGSAAATPAAAAPAAAAPAAVDPAAAAATDTDLANKKSPLLSSQMAHPAPIASNKGHREGNGSIGFEGN